MTVHRNRMVYVIECETDPPSADDLAMLAAVRAAVPPDGIVRSTRIAVVVESEYGAVLAGLGLLVGGPVQGAMAL